MTIGEKHTILGEEYEEQQNESFCSLKIIMNI